jgi:hypothetical protein
MVDWLHTVDLGVGADCLGNLFVESLQFMPGASKKEKVLSLWGRIRSFYKECAPASQLQTLTPEMLQMAGRPPKLRAKAAECRYLLPFGAALAKQFAGESPHCSTVYQLFQNLLTLATLLPQETWDAAKAKAACQSFCRLYGELEKEALENGNTLAWRIKPKLHLLVELVEFQCVEGDSPSTFWTYMDESWGSTLATAGSRRGGAKWAHSTALNVIQRFRCMTTPSDSIPQASS